MVPRLKTEDREYLQERLGGFATEHELRQNIKLHTLNSWRQQGILDCIRINSTWFYSLKSVKEAIQTSNINQLK